MKHYTKTVVYIFVALFLLAGILLRLQNLSWLPIDAHPMRQTDTESVAYFYAFKDANILHPQASLIRPVTNTDGYFFLEFPIYQYMISGLYRIFGWSLVAARLFNLFLFLCSVYFLYIFSKTFFSKVFAVAGIFFFTFAPGSLFFIGHAIHPDVFAVTTFLLSLYLLSLWKTKKKDNKFIIFSIIFLSISVATRPFIVLLVPGILFLLYQNKPSSKLVYIGYCVSPVLYGIWKLWQMQFAHADSSWENWVLDGRTLLLQPAILKTLIMKNVVGEVIGKFISMLAGFGLLLSLFLKKKRFIPLLLWIATLHLYWLIAPNGNIMHQYYANIYIVPFCLLAAVGAEWAWQLIKNRIVQIVLMILIGCAVMYNGYRTSSYFFLSRVPEEHIRISKDIEACTPKNAKIIYLAVNNSIPTSLVHRQGWMLGYWPTDVDKSVAKIMTMKKYGATHIVSGVNNTDITEEQWSELKINAPQICATQNVRVLKFN